MRSDFFESYDFIKSSFLASLKRKDAFPASYMSINVPISFVPGIFSYSKSEREKFRKFEPELVELYPDDQLHFSLAAILRLENDPKVEKIKQLVGPRMKEIIKLIEKEKAALRSFKIAAKFTKVTDQSIFVFCSFEKDAGETLDKFQHNVADKIYELLKTTPVKKYKRGKQFGRPVNFARWNVERLPGNAKRFFDNYTKGFTEEIKAKGEVKEVVLTYSDQFWSNPKENIVKEFKLK